MIELYLFLFSTYGQWRKSWVLVQMKEKIDNLL
jgi:hypothetical protein